MIPIDNLTNRPNQITTVLLADGSQVTLQFIYRPAIQRWSVDVQWQNFTARGIGLSTHPNLLRIWRRIIPFGLQVVTVDGTDPFLADDLSSGRVTINMPDDSAGTTEIDTIEVANFQ